MISTLIKQSRRPCRLFNLAGLCGIMPGWDACTKAEDAARAAININLARRLAPSALAFVQYDGLWDI